MIHLDFETTSPADLIKVGAYRYASEPGAKILCLAVGDHDEDEILTWSILEPVKGNRAILRLKEAISAGESIVAHNAQFELPILEYCGHGIDLFAQPALSQWICTAAMCRIAAIPASLEKAAEFLKLGDMLQKDKDGKRLIRKFCITGTDPASDPEDFAKLVEYCAQDVRVEKAVYDQLASQGVTLDSHPILQQAWELDKLINHRGIPINMDAAAHAQGLVDEATRRAQDGFSRITGGLSANQRDKTLSWLKERGYPCDTLTAADVRNAMADTSWAEGNPEALDALLYRQQVSYAAVKKVRSMLDCACPHGMVRGSLMFYGASTGRWAGRLIQPQNFKRPTIKDTKGAYSMICEHYDLDDLQICYGDALEVISSCVRHFIHPQDGRRILDADYSAIEARLVCWLAGQDDAVNDYQQGVDRYKVMASLVFGVPVAKITGDQRFIGKTAILGCGYGMGPARFFDQTKQMAEAIGITGIKVTEPLAKKAVSAWRTKHDKVVKLWHRIDDCVREAISISGRWVQINDKLACRCKGTPWANYLQVRLPSGRCINYPNPKISLTGEITYYGAVAGKAAWGQGKTYGASILENITQGAAWDLMVNGTQQATQAGYEVFSLIHDQALAYSDESKANDGLDGFIAALKTLPPWAKGLPLGAEGSVGEFYSK